MGLEERTARKVDVVIVVTVSRSARRFDAARVRPRHAAGKYRPIIGIQVAVAVEVA